MPHPAQAPSRSTKVRRKHKGLAGNGGQFAATHRGESAVRVESPAVSEVDETVAARLRESGVSGDPEFTRAISRQWSRRFYPDGLTAHTPEDRAILEGDLPPWRVLATLEEVEQANRESIPYVRARREADPDVEGARQVFEATDQMLVELGAEDSRRKREMFGMVLTQAAILAVPRKYRYHAQGAFSAYMIVKSALSSGREYRDVDVESATAQILDQQAQVRAQVHPRIEQVNARRLEAERAQWQAGLGSRGRSVPYRGQEVRYLDTVTGKPRVDPEDVDSELDVEIV